MEQKKEDKDDKEIQKLTEEKINYIDEEDDKKDIEEMTSLLSEMIFTAPYEKYIINMINKIFKENYVKIEPLFTEKTFNIDDIINEFKNIIANPPKKQKQNISFNNEIDQKEQNKSFSNKSGNKNKSNSKSTELSFQNLKSKISYDKVFNEQEEFEENRLFPQTFCQKDTEKNKKEIGNFLDTFNLYGKEYETHIQILLAEILRCFTGKEERYKFLCNIQYNLENINIKTKNKFKNMELDFFISNLDNKLFKSLILYLKKNILLLKFGNTIYEFNKKQKLDDILNYFDKEKNFDILGEIGINAVNDKNKIEQFINYSDFLKVLKENVNKTDESIDSFYIKTGFKKENEKILFFITDSKFNTLYKNVNTSILYKEMKNNGSNFVLCYMSAGINEKIVLSNFLFDKEKINEYEELYEKIKSSNESYFKSEKFKKSCNKMNELISKINKIKKIYYEANRDFISESFTSFADLFLDNSLKLDIDLEEYFKSKNIEIKYNIKKENQIKDIVALYLKSDFSNDNGKIEETLKNSGINYKIIYLNINEKSLQDDISELKKSHKSGKIYIFICNNRFLKLDKIIYFVNELILNLNIGLTNFLIIYSKYDQNKDEIYGKTLKNNIYIVKDNNGLIETIDLIKKRIDSIYLDLKKIFTNKHYYDLLIKIYVNSTNTHVMKSSNSEKENFIAKINEILYFMCNLNFIPNIPEKIDNDDKKALFAKIDSNITDFLKDNYNKNIHDIFSEITKLFINNNNKIFDETENQTKKFCFNFLYNCFLKNIYYCFINNTISKLSMKIFNVEIKKCFEKHENDK
jgi:hypothetical protein